MGEREEREESEGGEGGGGGGCRKREKQEEGGEDEKEKEWLEFVGREWRGRKSERMEGRVWHWQCGGEG